MKKLFLLLLLSVTFANSSVVELIDKNFESKLKESNRSIVMFYAPWCGACSEMKPTYFKTSNSFEGKVGFFLMNADEQKKLSVKYGIRSIPTIIVFENGKEVKRNVGLLDKVEIEMFIEPDETIKKEHKKCMSGNSSSCMMLADFYEEKKDYNKTITYYEKSCEGDTDGCSYLGDIYYYGEIVEKNYVKAALLYQKACSGGDAYGCRSLGYMYDRAKGVALNHEKSVKFYTKACEGKDITGCCNLGYSYYRGEGVKKDYSKAFKFYKLACDTYFSSDNDSSANACNQIGVLYQDGNGIEKNYKKAFTYYKKSCSNGYAIGCSNLGNMYKYGLGVDKNSSNSIQAYKKACHLGDKKACNEIKD